VQSNSSQQEETYKEMKNSQPVRYTNVPVARTLSSNGFLS